MCLLSHGLGHASTSRAVLSVRFIHAFSTGSRSALIVSAKAVGIDRNRAFQAPSSGSPFCDHVRSVVCFCPKEQVIRIHAPDFSVIAAVQNAEASRNEASVEAPSETMRVTIVSASNGHQTVALVVHCSSPKPTAGIRLRRGLNAPPFK